MEALHHHISTTGCGIILCLIGLLLCYIIGKRRFNRRGIGGLQQYSSYAAALVISNIERLVRLAGIAAIIVGVLLLITAKSNHPTKAIQGKGNLIKQDKTNSNGN